MVGNPGNLRIETNLQVHPPAGDGDTNVSASLLSPSGRGRSLSFSQNGIPSLRISSEMPRSPVADSLSNMAMSQGIGKARNESRKLLAHILGQLKRRPMPPTLFKSLGNRSLKAEKGLDTVVRTVRVITAMKAKKSKSSSKSAPEPEDSDEDFIDDREFHTDGTFDLLGQARDVLMISAAQRWDIFSESGDFLNAPKSPSRRSSEDRTSFLRRRSVQASRSRSRSTSPSRKRHVRAPELLSECISILSSIISEDCRYQIVAPKPSKPSFSLQILTLDIAQFLLHAHRNNPRTVSQITLAIIPAFHTFPRAMHTRLLAFFEEGVLGEMLDQLGRLQGRQSVASHSPDDMLNLDNQAPMVSIQVDEVQDARAPSLVQSWRRWTSPDEGIHAGTTPEQEPSVYYLTSVISPLLAAILENVDLLANKIPTVHRFHHLIDRLIKGKPEVYLDLLSVIAYHTPRVRHRATSLLLSYWPKAVGHIVLTKPFPDVSYAAALARETIRDRRQSSARLPAAAIELSHAHQFVPWHFSSSSLPQIFEGFSQNECRVCSEPMEGFGLSCPFCMCSVHFDCYDYPEGSFFAQYSLDSEPDIQKVAVHRFCHVLPFRRDGSDPYVRHREHFFRLVNIFSLALCFVCQKPLWGCVTQGLKCNSCKHFVHTSCVRDAVPYCREESVTSSHMTVKWSVLRRTFVDHYRDLAFTEAEVSTKSYEEVCVFFAVLWTQLQILDNGIALGSIVIDDDSSGRGGRMQDFELHYLVALYKALLSSGNLPISGTLAEYLTENGLRPQDHVFYFDWNTLAYIISAVKLPHSDSDSNQAPNLLNVGLPSAIDDSDDNTHPFEVVSLAHVRNQLGDILQLTSESAVRHLLSHVQHIGILHRLDQEQDLWNNTPNPEQLQCSFPIPFGFDVSADIETLVAVIEACLSDLDLSVNEAGLLLLIRRFWPNGMLTAYSFQRLSKAILTWIFAEDDNLIIIMREYVARGRNLPGVRSGIEVQTWPSPANTRAAGGSSNSGGDYVASRRALLQRYAAPWMLAFHDRDITAYANTVYELLVEHAEGAYTDDYFLKSLSEQETQKRNAAISDRILRHIIKICQASVVFTVFEDLFHRWLEQAHMLNTLDEPNTSLTRLFNAGSEAVNRFSSAGDQRGTFSDVSSITNTNPLYELLAAAKVDKNGFQHGLHWLCLFVSSTVDVPITAFTQMAQLAERFQADLDDCALLIKAALWSSYQKSLGRQELQGVVAALHVHLTTQILDGLRSRERVSEITTFIRQSLATCLLLYGCDREGMKGGGIILEEEIKVLVSRRKLNSRASMLTDPIIVDPRLMAVLKSYVEMGVDEVSCLAARFLNLLVNESPLLESYEVDNFILRNGPTLCQCMWSFYGIELSDVSVTRAALLLRILVVDTQPFQSLLVQQFEGQDDWQLRMQSLSWLFRMVLDVTSPAFVLDDRQWRPSIIDIFYYFFSALWLDDREEIRLTVETWSQTLLPAHHEAITLCWNEALSKAPIGERSRLIHFLLQLRPHFPLWRVLHWDGIIETLLENDFDQRNGEDDDGAAAAHLSMYGLSSNKGNGSSSSDSELRLLQVSLLSLSLRMIADGITIDIVSLLKIKEHLVRLIGSPEVSLVSSGAGQSFYVSYGDLGSVSQWSFPCLDDLLLVLDAWHPYDLSPSAMGGPYANEDNRAQLLIGSAFADVLLSIFIFAEDIINLPPLTLKNLLKALLAVIYKHDLDSRPLKHLQGHLRRALRRTLDLVVEGQHISYELRQLALSACQAFIKRWPAIIGNFVCEAIEIAVKVMISLNYEQTPEDMLVSQSRQFLETTLAMYSMSGVLNILFKRPQPAEFFSVLRHVMETKRRGTASTPAHANLRDGLLRDTLPRAVENDLESYQTVIENISTYVEMVYHQKYTSDLMQFIGLFLTNIARRTADWSTFDPSPLLLMASTVIQHNKSQCRELLIPLETFIRSTFIRSNISVASIDKVLQVTTSLYRKSVEPDQMLSKNQIALAIVELLYDGLVGKARITAVTLTSLMEALVPDKDKETHFVLPADTLTRLADVGLYYLNPENGEASSNMDFTASQAVAKMVLTVSQERPGLLSKIAYPDVSNQHPKPRNPSMTIRAWNLILLSAASCPSGAPAQMLLTFLPSFASEYSRCLRPYSQMETAPQDLLHFDVNRAYASIRLWLILCRKAASGDHDILGGTWDNPVDKETLWSRIVWNELWPPLETVVHALPTDIQIGSLAALASSVASSVADLFLFLRQMQCVVSTEVSSQITLLSRLRVIKRAEAKINRALRSLSEAPTHIPLNSTIAQIQTEIRAEERLEAAGRQDAARVAPERMRRIAS